MEHLRLLAEEAIGLQYDSAEAQAILDRRDWQDYWPVVNSDGTLTGEIVGCEDGYLNVDDMAMIPNDEELTEAQRKTIDEGYITL